VFDGKARAKELFGLIWQIPIRLEITQVLRIGFSAGFFHKRTKANFSKVSHGVYYPLGLGDCPLCFKWRKPGFGEYTPLEKRFGGGLN